MIKKKILVPQRVRRTGKSFCFIPHRFLTDGFLQSLSLHELAVYLFLVLASDKNGIFLLGRQNHQICSGA